MYGLPEIHTRIECEDLLRWAQKDMEEAYRLMVKGVHSPELVAANDRARARVEFLEELLGCLIE